MRVVAAPEIMEVAWPTVAVVALVVPAEAEIEAEAWAWAWV